MLPEALTAIGAALLLLTGGAKLFDPDPTAGALRAAGLPSGTWAARLLGGVEIVVALPALAWGGVWAGGVGALYLAFAGFVGWALVRGIPLQSCGCFGRADTPPTILHVAFNTSIAIGAFAAAAVGGDGVVAVVADQPWFGLPYLGYLGLGVYLSYLVLAELPRTLAAMQGTR